MTERLDEVIKYIELNKISTNNDDIDDENDDSKDRIIEIDLMKNMSIDQIIELYKNGYKIETFPTTSKKYQTEIKRKRNTRINIDRYRCCYCGACVSVCPANALELIETWLYINEDCTNCSTCTNICPVGALEMTNER